MEDRPEEMIQGNKEDERRERRETRRPDRSEQSGSENKDRMLANSWNG